MEAEVNKLQRSLETVRLQHQALQKQYSEQCSEAEKYRNLLRVRDNEVREFEHREYNHAHELEKVRVQISLMCVQLSVSQASRDREVLEDQIKLFEADLIAARQAQAELDGQKNENLMLKETIDRLRFDLDELRTSSANAESSRRAGSGPPTLSRSLGSEFARRLLAKGLTDTGSADESGGDDDSTIEKEVISLDTDGEEDVFQTIITRKRVRSCTSGRRHKLTLSLFRRRLQVDVPGLTSRRRTLSWSMLRHSTTRTSSAVPLSLKRILLDELLPCLLRRRPIPNQKPRNRPKASRAMSHPSRQRPSMFTTIRTFMQWTSLRRTPSLNWSSPRHEKIEWQWMYCDAGMASKYWDPFPVESPRNQSKNGLRSRENLVSNVQ